MSQSVTTVVESVQKINGANMANEVSYGKGLLPAKERWPFSSLQPGEYFTCRDLKKHTALRTAASRAKRKYQRVFTVRKVRTRRGHTVIRVYSE